MAMDSRKKTLERETSEDVEKQRLLTVFRVCQYLFLAIFAFGIAWSLSDLAVFYDFPITGWALGCTVFGAQGGFASEFIIRRLERELKRK
ncbi:MAG: hypothetical protein ACW976_03060 [Candidatus Ranarchaeia archaeon]|jgi:hypothetical protein